MKIQVLLKMIFETKWYYNNGFVRVIRQFHPLINFEILSIEIQ